MLVIEKRQDDSEFNVRITKEEKNLIDAYNDLKKTMRKDSNILLINPETYFGYNIETGKAVALEFTELDYRKY